MQRKLVIGDRYVIPKLRETTTNLRRVTSQTNAELSGSNFQSSYELEIRLTLALPEYYILFSD